jgi:hypothetical protein
MTAEPRGRDLFIVDNSVSGWTALRYLEEWSGIGHSCPVGQIILSLMPKAPLFEWHFGLS